MFKIVIEDIDIISCIDNIIVVIIGIIVKINVIVEGCFRIRFGFDYIIVIICVVFCKCSVVYLKLSVI